MAFAPPLLASAADVLPKTAVIRVLVGAMADSSLAVREAAAAALRENSKSHADIVLDCCSGSLRVGKRRGGPLGSHHAGVLNVMAHAVGQLDRGALDDTVICRIAQVALAEMTSPKELASEWQQASSLLLVAAAGLNTDVVLHEMFLQLSAGAVPVVAIVRTLSELAEVNGSLLVPRLKLVLSRIVPTLGSIKDAQRSTFAEAFTCWFAAYNHYIADRPDAAPLLDADVMALIQSAYDLFLNYWLYSREPKVCGAVAEAVGQLAGLIGRQQLKVSLNKLLPALLNLYKKIESPVDQLPVTRGLYLSLKAALLFQGQPPLLDFSACEKAATSLLPMAGLQHSSHVTLQLAASMKNEYEVLRCFQVLGCTYPDQSATFLVQRLECKDSNVKLGALQVLRYLLSRLGDKLRPRRQAIVEAVRAKLGEKDLLLQKAVLQVVVALAANGYLDVQSGEPFVDFLVRHSSILVPDFTNGGLKKDSGKTSKLTLQVGGASPEELRAMADKSLSLLSSTVPAMEDALWPSILMWLLPYQYTVAAATVCRSATEIAQRRLARGDPLFNEHCRSSDVPLPQELLARLLVLLHHPMEQGELGPCILKLLYLLAPYFDHSLVNVWEDELPRMLAYVSTKQETWQQSDWDAMVIKLLEETLSLVGDQRWIAQLGNAFAEQYVLYRDDHEHTALLHRCFGMVLQKMEDTAYVRPKIELMYSNADLANEVDREGLAMGIGLVAASHLEAVLEKLRRVLEQHKRKLRKLFSFFFESPHTAESENVCATVALMYGYAASYAPPAALEGRINKLVGTGVLTDLLDVTTQSSKQGVIKAINLLGQAVLQAGHKGVPFQLRQRDDLLGHIMMLMAGSASSAPDAESLPTKSLALVACTTLVSVEPRLSPVMRDRLLEATLPFFGLPAEPSHVIEALIINLNTLLLASLQTCGDGTSRGHLLQGLLRSLDRYLASPDRVQRKRAVSTVLSLLQRFRHLSSTTPAGPQSSPKDATPSEPLLPTRDCLKLGGRLMAYLPRCTDPLPVVRHKAAQVVEELVSIAVMLPRNVKEGGRGESVTDSDTWLRLRDLKEKITAEASAEQVAGLRQMTRAISGLLTLEEVFRFLRSCGIGICDPVPQSARGAVAAIQELILARRLNLSPSELARVAYSLLKAAAQASDTAACQGAITALEELGVQGDRRVVFGVLLEAVGEAGREGREAPEVPLGLLEQAVQALAVHAGLGLHLLDYLLEVLRDQVVAMGDDNISSPMPRGWGDQRPRAATWALGAAFRAGGRFEESVLKARFAAVLCAFIVRLGSMHHTCQLYPAAVKEFVGSFQAFSAITGDPEMQQVLGETDGEQRVCSATWTDAVEEAAACTARTRADQVDELCDLLWPVLKNGDECQRAAAAAALAEFMHHLGENWGSELLQHLVGALSQHAHDRSPLVRRLCLRGLLQVPQSKLPHYAAQVLAVVVSLVEDPEEEVAFTAVRSIPTLVGQVTESAMAPLLLGLCIQLRALQGRESVSMRAAAFSAFGALSRFGHGPQQEAFLEQVHAALPWVAFHMQDDAAAVRHACRETLAALGPLLEGSALSDLFAERMLESDQRSKYDEFLRDFAWQLATLFRNRIDVYMTGTLQAFESPWPDIQANAAYFGACLLSQLLEEKPVADYLPQVTGSLVKMAASGGSPVVRSKAASALGILLRDACTFF